MSEMILHYSIVLVSCLGLAHAKAQPQAREQYIAPEADALGGELPLHFNGEIKYVGQQSAEVSKPGKPPRINSRNLLGSVLSAATKRGQTQQFGGGLTLTVVYSGDKVKGTYSGSGGMAAGTWTGTRRGNVCTAYNDRDGSLWQGQCDARRFSGTFSSPLGATPSVRGKFMATASGLVDYAQRDQQRTAAVAERQRLEAVAQSEKRLAVAAEQAKLASLPKSSPSLKAAVVGAITSDATNWAVNRLDSNSITDVRTLESGSVTKVRAQYTFNDGTPGWATAEIAGGKVQCLVYHDRTGCSPARPKKAALLSNSDNNMIAGSQCFEINHETVSRVNLFESETEVYTGYYKGRSVDRRTRSYLMNVCSGTRKLEVHYPDGVQVIEVERYRDSVGYNPDLKYRDLGASK